MALLLKGGEYITTEALSATTLSRLMSLARRQPLLINGVELRHQDLASLADEAQRTGNPVWPGCLEQRSCLVRLELRQRGLSG